MQTRKERKIMENLDVKIVQTAGKIECNFDEIRSALAVQMSAYDDVVVSQDEIADAKHELATLRKIRKAVDDRRKEVKKSFNKPYEQFEEEVKKLLAEIDKPIEKIDSQIKMFQEEFASQKKSRCLEIYNEVISDYKDFLPFEKIFIDKWLNATYSETDIRYDISEKIAKVKSDLSVIDGLNSEIKDELIKTYINSDNDLSKAVTRNSQYIADKQKIEQAQKEAETKVETKEPEVETKEQTPIEQLDDLSKMVRTAKIIVSVDDLPQIREMLDFAEIKYQIAD